LSRFALKRRVLIVGEGRETEFNYFVGFRNTFEEELEATATSVRCHHLGSTGTARRTNPSTQVYELIAILIGVQTGEKCPIAGTWKLIGDPSVTIKLTKGKTMPTHTDNPANWQF
jgi:hypothetical protein